MNLLRVAVWLIIVASYASHSSDQPYFGWTPCWSDVSTPFNSNPFKPADELLENVNNGNCAVLMPSSEFPTKLPIVCPSFIKDSKFNREVLGVSYNQEWQTPQQFTEKYLNEFSREMICELVSFSKLQVTAQKNCDCESNQSNKPNRFKRSPDDTSSSSSYRCNCCEGQFPSQPQLDEHAAHCDIVILENPTINDQLNRRGQATAVQNGQAITYSRKRPQPPQPGPPSKLEKPTVS